MGGEHVPPRFYKSDGLYVDSNAIQLACQNGFETAKLS